MGKQESLGGGGERGELELCVGDAVDGDAFQVGRHEDGFGELLLEEGSEGLHLGAVAVDEHDVLGVDIAEEINDALGVGVGGEGDVDDLHLDLVELLVERDLLGAAQEAVAERALNAVARDDQRVPLVGAPLLEHLHARPPVQHPRRGEQHIRHVRLEQRLVEGTHLLELEHVVSAREFLLDLLVLPVHEQPVKEVRALDQPCREVDRHAAVRPLPVALQQHRQLLRPPQREHRNQHLPAALHRLRDQLQHRPLPVPLGVADGAGVGGLGDEQVGREARRGGSAEVAIGVGVVVAGVDHRESGVLDVEHAGAEDVAGVVGGDLDAVDLHRLEQPDALHAVGRGPHLARREDVELLLLLLLSDDLAVVLEHEGEERLGGCGGEDGPRIAVVLGEVGEGAAVVEVEVREQDEVHGLVDAARRRVELREVGVAAAIGVEHVDAHVEHHRLVAQGHAHARTPHVLPRPQAHHLHLRQPQRLLPAFLHSIIM